MQFGWLTLSLSPSPEEDRERIQQLIEQVVTAEALGFSDVWLTEHYFTGESVYNDALMFAAALTQKTSRVRIGFAVVQMPFHHPVRLATQLALLDNLSGGRIDVGIGKGTVFNEYEFIGYGLRSEDSRERMAEAMEVLQRAFTDSPLVYDGRYFKLNAPALRPAPVQQPGPPLWRSVISPGSFTECGKLGIPILTARIPLSRIKERWRMYEAGLIEGGHDTATRERLLSQAALWRYVYVAESDAQAEDELRGLLARTRSHMMHVRHEYNPPDFHIDPVNLNAWTDPGVSEADGVQFTLDTGAIYGSAKTVKEQVAALKDAGVRHLLCQTGFGDMDHEQNIASMQRFGTQVMPSFKT
jgi:alkanesulfonate monooxygenase SsuD/methylene tetrahydromethanopterin reductase-like flavin-dependent oxidoreductase (luciferase family)